jgi:Na+/melibiose symporter-like transporter
MTDSAFQISFQNKMSFSMLKMSQAIMWDVRMTYDILYLGRAATLTAVSMAGPTAHFDRTVCRKC